MAEIPENSRLFRKAEPPKKQLSRKFGSGKLNPEPEKRTSEFGKRVSEYSKRTSELIKRSSEIGKRASEIDGRGNRPTGIPSKRTSFDNDAATTGSLPPGNYPGPSDDSPPANSLSPPRRISSSQATKSPRAKTPKSPATGSKPLSSQRVATAQPGTNVTGGSRHASVEEGGSRRGSSTGGAEKRVVAELDNSDIGKRFSDGEERFSDRDVEGAETRDRINIRPDVSAALINHEADLAEDESPGRQPRNPRRELIFADNPSASHNGATTPGDYGAVATAEDSAGAETDAVPAAASAAPYETSAGLEKVVVAVRVRPLTERERGGQTRQAVVIQGPKITLYEEPPRTHRSADGAASAGRGYRSGDQPLQPGAQEFTFDLVQNDGELMPGGNPRAKAEMQEALFQALGHQCLNSALEGYNVTMFAYGQTGAGKSFSMMGDYTEEGAGIIPRLAAKLLQRLKEKRDAGTDVSLEVTYLEIYREQVRDLLAHSKVPPSYFQDADSERDDSDGDRDTEPTSDSEQSSAPGGRTRAPSLRVMVQAKLAAQRFVKRARKVAKPGSTRFAAATGEDSGADDDVGNDVASVAGSEGSVDSPERTIRGGQTKGGSAQGARAILKIREHPDKGPYVEGLSERHVASWPEMAALLEEGSRNRTVAATDMNKVSSRSHTVFTLTVKQTKASPETGIPYHRVSKINLVDLAGSERQNRTNATGARLKESGYINKSLSLLNDVITELARGSDFVPYRNSNLTWLLKESLGGNSKTVMVASISPAEKDVRETLSTLRYANRAKRIKNKPVLNEDPREKLIKALRAEIESLRAVVQTMAVPGALGAAAAAPPGAEVPVASLQRAVQPEAPGESPTLATGNVTGGILTTGGVTESNPRGEESLLAHSVATRLLGNGAGNDAYKAVPDSPTSSMLTPVEGFSVNEDTWDTFTGQQNRPHASTWTEGARDLAFGLTRIRASSERNCSSGTERRRPDVKVRTRRSSDMSEEEGVSVSCTTETDPLLATATEGTETEPEIRPATRDGGIDAEVCVATLSTGSDACVVESVEEGTEADLRAESATCSTETNLPEVVTEGTDATPIVATSAAWTETVPLDVQTEGTETERKEMVDDGTDSGVQCTDAQSGTETLALTDSATVTDKLESVSSATETEPNGVNSATDTDGLILCASESTGSDGPDAVDAEIGTEVPSVVVTGTGSESAETTDGSTETEPEVEKRVVHAARRFEGFSSAVGCASPFLVQLLVGSDHKVGPETEPEKETETEPEPESERDDTRLLENPASNKKLAAGLRVLRRLGIAVDETFLFREAAGEGLAAHALEVKDGSEEGVKASWAVHVLAPGVNSIGSDPSVGFKISGGLAKEHVELVLAPPAAGKAVCATVIARTLNDAPALLNGMPLPRFAELRNGDCILLGDPTALGDGSGDAALFYFFNPLCNLPTLTQSILSPKTFSPPGSPIPLSARLGEKPGVLPGDQDSGLVGFKSPLSLLLRPLDVRPPGQEAATWSLGDSPVLDVDTWAFIMADEMQRSGSVSNQTVGAFLEDVRTGESGCGREPAPQKPLTPFKAPRAPRGRSTSHKSLESPPRGLGFSHKTPESPPRGISFSHKGLESPPRGMGFPPKVPESPHRTRESPSHYHQLRSFFN